MRCFADTEGNVWCRRPARPGTSELGYLMFLKPGLHTQHLDYSVMRCRSALASFVCTYMLWHARHLRYLSLEILVTEDTLCVCAEGPRTTVRTYGVWTTYTKMCSMHVWMIHLIIIYFLHLHVRLFRIPNVYFIEPSSMEQERCQYMPNIPYSSYLLLTELTRTV